MDYFVTVNGITVYRNTTKNKAVAIGKEKYNDTSNIGIGRNKIVKGKKVFVLLPLSYFI